MTLACEEYGAGFFENGATPGGVPEHPGVLKDPAKVRESWYAVYGGFKNAGKVSFFMLIKRAELYGFVGGIRAVGVL